MGKALYRKYRSKGFDEIIGQSHVTDLLKNAISTGKIAHAYLLTGPRGVGKTSVARIIAHQVNGLDYSEDTDLDIIEIDAASNRRIDDIRDLRDKVHIAPVSSKYKVYIIDEVHMLTGESFNALLKTLEEPPEHVIFILATTEVHKVPATIVSRTQRYHFRPATVADIVTHLGSIAQKENIPYDEDALELIATHAAGSFRDSVSLLDQLSGLSETITVPLVESVLGMASQDRIDTLVQAVIEADTDSVLGILDKLEAQGVSPTVIVTQIVRILNQKARTQHGLFVLIDQLLEVSRSYHPQLKLLTTLVQFIQAHSYPTIPPRTRSTAPKETITPPRTSAPTTTPKNVPTSHDVTPVKAANPVRDDQPPAQPASPSESLPRFDWEKVLKVTKSHHKPLHSVLSRAKVSFSDSTLHLTFAYALHRKKLENATYRAQLSAVIKDLFGITPSIMVDDTKHPASPKDPTIDAVADIMGGGEIIEADV